MKQQSFIRVASMACVAVLSAGFLLIGPGSAQAQVDNFPNKPVRIVLPWAVGGLADISTRMLAKELEAKWKQPVVVENKPGGNEVIASEIALAAPADGYTIYYQSQNVGLNPLVQKQPFGVKDFRMLGRNMEFAYILFTTQGLPVNSLAEFMSYAKTKPDGVSYGHSGNFTKLGGLRFAEALGTKFVDIPYAGGTPIQQAIMGGHVDFYFGTTFDVVNFPAGKAKMLAVTTPKRHPQFPDLPAIAEVAPGFDVVSWTGYAVKTGTPKPLIEKIAKDINEVMRLPQIVEWHTKRGLVMVYETPDESQAYVDKQSDLFAKLAKQAGFTPQ